MNRSTGRSARTTHTSTSTSTTSLYVLFVIICNSMMWIFKHMLRTVFTVQVHLMVPVLLVRYYKYEYLLVLHLLIMIIYSVRYNYEYKYVVPCTVQFSTTTIYYLLYGTRLIRILAIRYEYEYKYEYKYEYWYLYCIVLILIVSKFSVPRRKDLAQPTNNSHLTD